MGARVGRGLWTFFSIVLVAGVVGCTTNLTPPSGPPGKEVCFDPAPFTWFGAEGEFCGWRVALWYDATTSYPGPIFADGNCFTIPTSCSVGDEFLVQVSGATFMGCISFQPLWYLSAFGHFTVTE